ncbi:MAG: hypothetical protein AW07_01808 [Candidatus Accumulibacter sp. SK-11]|nr:MAG: hypothetical protein AW07_01808 [Candidatus Accumulibacter sp. SK-11]
MNWRTCSSCTPSAAVRMLSLVLIAFRIPSDHVSCGQRYVAGGPGVAAGDRHGAGPSGRMMPYSVSANNSRPISMRRISEVPAPISYSLASRHRRPAG